MVYKELICLFEKRKRNLIDTLRNGSSEIDLGKQHQLFGAIKELELVLENRLIDGCASI